jgi:transcription antitermination factor NusG
MGDVRAAGGLRPAIDEERWYAAHTLPHREIGAARQLEFQGFKAFLPIHLKTIRHARRFRTIKAPFFLRYLFVRLNLARDRWRSVNGTIGVASLIMEGEYPKPVPFGIVEELMAITDASGTLSLAPLLEPGQRVQILTGPFAGRIGDLVQADDKMRVQILLEVMGASVTVHSSANALVPVA